MKKRILMLAKDAALRAAVACILQPAGYAVELAGTTKRARELVTGGRIDAAIVATRSIGENGFQLAAEIRDAIGRVLVVTDGTKRAERLGAAPFRSHDVLSEPLDGRVLLERLAQMTAAGASAGDAPVPAMLRFEGRSIDVAGRAYFDANGREIPLTRAEFALLLALAQRPGRVLSREQLRSAVGGRVADPFDRSIDMLVGRLRRKIEPDQKTPVFIVTVPGEGYKFAVRPQACDAAIPPPERADEAAWSDRQPRLERRHMSVLACQVGGLAALFDPEDLHTSVAAFHRACAEVVTRFGGVVVDAPGDRVMAYFGYPDAREDDAERAVRAALELVAMSPRIEIGSKARLQPRFGIASGIMVVGEASGAAQGPAAAGQPLNLALQLCEAARQAGIVIDARTHALLGAFF
ncbi:MAG: winged helix-turn-helix domain-containing protein, partial [Caulobacteraceae bacterium]|nr:winged helix-turn-helix domain-containing protein [Caulobacteraceae bacterium]